MKPLRVFEECLVGATQLGSRATTYLHVRTVCTGLTRLIKATFSASLEKEEMERDGKTKEKKGKVFEYLEQEKEQDNQE